MLEKLARDKRSSLFGPFLVPDEDKKFDENLTRSTTRAVNGFVSPRTDTCKNEKRTDVSYDRNSQSKYQVYGCILVYIMLILAYIECIY